MLPSRTCKYFFNAAYVGEDIPENIKEFYEFIRTGNATGVLTRNLEVAVQSAKRNEQWRSQYMKERLIYQDYKMEGREEGIAIGREEGIAIGRKMAEEQALARIKELEEQIVHLQAEKM